VSRAERRQDRALFALLLNAACVSERCGSCGTLLLDDECPHGCDGQRQRAASKADAERQADLQHEALARSGR
jgi:hypothetical protein